MPGIFYKVKYMIKDVVLLRGVKKENYVFKLHILWVFFEFLVVSISATRKKAIIKWFNSG